MLSKEKQQTVQYIMITAGMLIMLGVVAMRLFNIEWEHDRWIFAFGAVMTLAERLTERYDGKNMRLKILYRMGKISALLYCISAYFIISPTGKLRDCLAFLVAGGVMQIYCSIAYEHEVKKENKK